MERASSGRRGDEGAAGREARAISFRSREDGVLLLDRSSLVRDFHSPHIPMVAWDWLNKRPVLDHESLRPQTIGFTVHTIRQQIGRAHV